MAILHGCLLGESINPMDFHNFRSLLEILVVAVDMASLLLLSAELKLEIIELIGRTSAAFVPTPSRELLRLSRVCKVFRTLTLPLILNNITLLSKESPCRRRIQVHSAIAK